MRIMFVYWRVEDAGSAQTIAKYAEAAEALGHQVALYAPDDATSRFRCSLDIGAADTVVFVLEWNIYLHHDEPLDIEGAMRTSRREQRIVIDNDGMYNDPITVGGDYNHPSPSDSSSRMALYESISDRIYQPTLHPLRANVRSFLFHGYDPAWETPLDFSAKDYGMYYVGSNWFRWRAMERVLRAVESIRPRVGRIGLVGHNWDAPPAGVESPLREQAYRTDPALLRRLDVELLPPVPVDQVISTMSRGVFNPVLVRPLFNHLRLVNPRLFETPAANTIPLFGLDPGYVQEVHGEDALELVLGDRAADQIEDVLRRPRHYAKIVARVRRHLAEHHSFAARFRQLLEIAKS